MAAPEATDETGRVGANAARASDRAIENTQKLCYIRLNSLLPVRVIIKSAGVLHVERRADRRELRRLLSELATGEVLMVTRFDRPARSTRDLLNAFAVITGNVSAATISRLMG
jgi:DNA invertase Pin-like site-specific DNA recombinase